MRSAIKNALLSLSQTNKKIEELNFSFILSTGRTGTNFFEDFINNNFKQVISRHEPNPDLFHLGTRVYRENMKEKEVDTLLKSSRKELINEIHSGGNKNYVESNPFLSYFAPYLNNTFDSPKIIHIVRHPDTYVFSAINKDPNNSGNLFMSDLDHRKRVCADDIKGDKYFGKWSEMNQFERICWNWVYTNNLIYDNLHELPNYKLIKYEDFFLNSNIDQLNEVIDFIGISNLSNLPAEQLVEKLSFKRNESKERYHKDYEELKSNNLKFYNEMITKTELNKFGYDL